MKLIKSTYWFGRPTRDNPDDGVTASYDQDDHDRIRAMLLGHTVEKVEDDHLVVDDGTVVKVVPNNGGCSCGAGDYWLESLNGVDNVITRVAFRQGETDSDGETYGTYEVFVFTGHKEINLLTVAGDDGSGYYGTGYKLLIRAPEEER